MSQEGQDGVAAIGGAFFFCVALLMGSCTVDMMSSKITRVEYKCLSQEIIIKKDIPGSYNYHISVKGGSVGGRVSHKILEGYVYPGGYHYSKDGYDLNPGYSICINEQINLFGNTKGLNLWVL